MAIGNISSKRIQINKANSTIVLVVSIASIVTAFSLMSCRALLGQRSYQSRVITEQKAALNVTEDNIKSVDTLVASYQAFNSNPENIIGGSSTGRGDNNGDNAKVVLDALPSQYDFPALVSSFEKLLKDRNFETVPLGADSVEPPAATGDMSAVEIPIQLSIDGNYNATLDLLNVLDRNIRPVVIDTLTLTGGEGKTTLTVSGKTYYQPGKTLTVTKKVVK